MKICIIGGGPSGMMAAISAKMHHQEHEVILIDSNPILGKKMRLTGGGRCNVTADVDSDTVVKHVVKNGKFLYSALTNFATKDIIQFFEKEGCPLKMEDHQRMFPQSNRSSDIVDALKRKMTSLGVSFMMNTTIVDVDPEASTLTTESASKIVYDALIIATGGKTLPQTGSNGVGYRFAERFGHTITSLVPAEVPLVSNERLIQEKTLQGLSFKDVEVTVYDGKKVKSRIVHDLLITHFGLSGPVALRSSFEVLKLLEKGPVTIEIDFIPGINSLDEAHPNLQKRLLEYVASLEGDALSHLKQFKMTIHDTRGFQYAFVTNGGVSVKEIDPKTMKSKLVSNLSFCGEVMDINAFTGGYNITSCLSTGYTAGKYCI